MPTTGETTSCYTSDAADDVEAPPAPPAPPVQVAPAIAAAAAAAPVKKTCEACVKAKIKCNGQQPCERCTRRGSAEHCVYLAEQKRGRRSIRLPKAASLISLASLPSSPAASPLASSSKRLRAAATAHLATSSSHHHHHHHHLPVSPFERRLFRITFSLFKYHRDDRNLAWFSRQFTVLGAVLRSRQQCGLEFANFSLHCTTRTAAAAPASSRLPSLLNLPRLPSSTALPPPSLLATSTTPPVFIGSIGQDGTRVKCSPGITHWLGYAEDGSNFPHARPTLNQTSTATDDDNDDDDDEEKEMLPWGADVLCATAQDDSQVLAYLRDVALAFAAQQPSKSTTLLLLQQPSLEEFGMTSRVALPLRAITLVMAALGRSGASPETTLRCWVACQVWQNASTGANCAQFDVYLHPQQQQLHQHATPTAASLLPHFALPDLELAPWPTTTTMPSSVIPASQLIQWASPPPFRPPHHSLPPPTTNRPY